MGQRVTFSGEVNRERGAVEKSSLNRAIVARSRPETERSSHVQNEGWVTPIGGSNRVMLKNYRMTCG